MLSWSFGGEKLLFSHIKCCLGLIRYNLHGKKNPDDQIFDERIGLTKVSTAQAEFSTG